MNEDLNMNVSLAPVGDPENIKTVYTVAQNWLDGSTGGEIHPNTTVTNAMNCSYLTVWPNWYSYPVRIVLKLSEVEHLRKICKNNAKLKEILNRFTPYIEVQVDF